MQLLRLLVPNNLRELRSIVLIAGLAGLANAALIGLINGVAASSAKGLEAEADSVLLFLVALGAYYVAQRTALLRANDFLEARLGELRLQLADKIRRAELRTLEGLGRGEVYTKVAQETNHLSQSFPLLVTAAQAAFLLCFCLAYVATLSFVSFVVVGGVTALALLAFWAKRRALIEQMTTVTQTEGETLETLIHFLEGFQELRLNADRSDGLQAHFDRVVTRLRELVVGIGETWVLLLMFSSAFLYLLLGAVTFILPLFFDSYTDIIYKLTAAAFFCVAPVGTITAVAPIFTKARIGLDQVMRLADLLDPPLRPEADGPPPILSFTGFQSIRCEGILFRYRDAQGQAAFTSGPWDLSLHRGELVFMLGGNGCGKSTALKLLCGLYRPEAGDIRVDGRSVSQESRPAYRELFSAIFTDFRLFDRLYGLEGVDPERVGSLLRRMELDEKVEYLDGRFSTQRLSTGQRKRLAMVVNLLEDREILIFDEWAADQERRFREVFYTELLPELKARGKTVVVVTHDDRYFHCCDRVIRLDLGTIVAAAPPPPAPEAPR